MQYVISSHAWFESEKKWLHNPIVMANLALLQASLKQKVVMYVYTLYIHVCSTSLSLDSLGTQRVEQCQSKDKIELCEFYIFYTTSIEENIEKQWNTTLILHYTCTYTYMYMYSTDQMQVIMHMRVDRHVFTHSNKCVCNA